MVRNIGMRLFFISFLIWLPPSLLWAQDTIQSGDSKILYGIVHEGDTIYVSTIDDVYIFPKHTTTSKRDMRKYQKLIYNVKVTLPYAKLAKQKYDEVSAVLLTMKTDREKDKYMEQVEKELKDQFEEDLKKLTISQGRILLKLIDREVGETSYDLLIEFRGKFSAFFWQTLAKIFGHNLKSTFDPEGEDQLLNEIVIMVENGQL
jgi:hypothetical protein